MSAPDGKRSNGHLIAFCGSAGAGKTTFARELVDNHRFHSLRFAGPLKAMLRAFLIETGMPPQEADDHIDGGMKEIPIPHLCMRSARFAMQTLGTEWGRDIVSPAIWVNAAKMEATRLIAAGHRVVFDDLRFPNEAEMIRDLGGVVVKIVPRDVAPLDHRSEKQEIEPDHVVFNYGGLDDVSAIVGFTLARIFGMAA